MNNSFKIIFMKFKIMKSNLIKIYTKNNHLATNKFYIIRIFINKDYIIISE